MEIYIKKCEKAVDVAIDELAPHIRDGIFAYGLRQLLNDAHANEPKPDLAWALMEKRLQALMAGTYRFGGSGGGAHISLVEAECRLIVAGLLVEKGLGKADAEKKAKDWRNVVPAEKDQATIMAKAEKNVASRYAEINIEIEL